MSYSDLYFEPKKKSMGLLLAVAFFSIFGFIGFMYSGSSTKTSQASGSILQESPKVANLRTTQSGIFWKSDRKEKGWIRYGIDKNNLVKTAYDVRDTESMQKEYGYHYVFIIDLIPNTTYFYKIFGGKTDNNIYKIVSYSESEKKPYSFVTPKDITLNQTIKPAYGKILYPNNSPASEAIVFFEFVNYYPLLAVTTISGEFAIPLNNLVEKTGNNIVVAKLDEKVKIVIYNDQDPVKKTQIVATLSQTNPLLKSIIVGNNYNFIEETEVLGVASKNNATTQEGNGSILNEKISILYPKDNSVIASQKPLIKGMAFPKKTVFVTINSIPEHSFRSIANDKGEWKVVTSLPLKNGDYELLMKTVDDKEKEVIIKKSFSVAKSGEQVMGAATAEPTLISQLPTETPTQILTPTPIGDQFFTPTATPPKTGLNNNYLVVISSSLIFFGLGILLVF